MQLDRTISLSSGTQQIAPGIEEWELHESGALDSGDLCMEIILRDQSGTELLQDCHRVGANLPVGVSQVRTRRNYCVLLGLPGELKVAGDGLTSVSVRLPRESQLAQAYGSQDLELGGRAC